MSMCLCWHFIDQKSNLQCALVYDTDYRGDRLAETTLHFVPISIISLGSEAH